MNNGFLNVKFQVLHCDYIDVLNSTVRYDFDTEKVKSVEVDSLRNILQKFLEEMENEVEKK